jgi:hypothetical protein
MLERRRVEDDLRFPFREGVAQVVRWSELSLHAQNTLSGTAQIFFPSGNS